MHPAIQSSIDYWREAAKLLPFGKPDHVSHYVVKEDGELRCYAVKWNGNDLDDNVIVVPPLAEGIIKEAIDFMGEEQIGTFLGNLSGKPMYVSCWVHSSPVREMDCWLSSISEDLTANQMPAPIVYATKWIEDGRT